jgi:hypothetical protein
MARIYSPCVVSDQGIDNFASAYSTAFMKSFFVLLIAGICGAALAQEKPANCELAPVVVVDGQANEWPLDWIADPDDPKFSYNVCSDNSNLYVRVKLKDETVRRKVALFGFTMWLDPNGKKKKKVGLKFPTGAEGTEKWDQLPVLKQNMSSGERSDYQKEVNRFFVKDLEILELIGLSDDPLVSTRSGITNGIKVAIGVDDEEAYIYEAIVPFKSFRLSKAAIENLGVGFETGKFVPKPQKSASVNANANSRGAQASMAGPMAYASSYWISIKMK